MTNIFKFDIGGNTFFEKLSQQEPPMFKSVKSNRVSEHIVEQIRKAIFEAQLKPGDKLPPERELMKAFHVSKVTLREAIRSSGVLGPKQNLKLGKFWKRAFRKQQYPKGLPWTLT